MRKAVLLSLAVGLAACPPPRDSGHVPLLPIVPGAAARADRWMGRRTAGAPAAHPARVHVMKPGEALGGPNAVGRPGDLVLENDEVVFVIDQLGSSAGFAESGGNLVDAADASARIDELGQVFTYFGSFPRQGVYDELRSGVEKSGAAWVEAAGRELYEPGVRVVTRYTLEAPDRALLITTRLTNGSDHMVTGLSLGDAVQWGGAEKVAPGMPLGFKGESSGAFIGGIGRFVGYGLTSTEGTIDAVSGSSWSDTAQRKKVSLAPGESAEYQRVLAVGLRGDLASVVAELTRAAGGTLGQLDVSLVDEAGKAVRTPAGAKVVLSGPSGGDLLSIRATKDGDPLTGDIPPGRYLASFATGGGRRSAGPKVAVTVKDGEVTKATLAVSGAGRLKVSCNEAGLPVPCKVTIEGTAGAASPDFGPAHVAGPAKHHVFTESGAADVPLGPGSYRVTLSRGPEYALVQREVTVTPGATAEPCADPAACALTRVVDTRGYVAADFHQHTMLGADAPVATRDRVIANAAEGVEIAVTSEHNVVADLSPVVRELRLERFLVEIAGNELTTDASKKPWGHANAFPLTADPAKPRGGALAVRDRSARECFDALRASVAAPFVLQINHPRTGVTGYFDQLGLDPKTGEGTDPGYDPRFDALEVWNGRHVDPRARVLADWLLLLRTKHPVTPTANTDTHGVVGSEPGYPRTYVRVGNDAALDAWDAARTADLVRGIRDARDVVLTNGPFLRVTAGGAPVGELARAKGGAIELRVHVESAPWVVVDQIEIRRASGEGVPAVRVAPSLGKSGALVADATLRVPVSRDDALVVVVSGQKPLEPVLAGDPREIAPWAMTGAIWIDADGDGESLGRRAAGVERRGPPR